MIDDLEKEIIKLEQLPAHDNVVRYLAHERCGPHFDTLRVYVTRYARVACVACHVLCRVCRVLTRVCAGKRLRSLISCGSGGSGGIC
jgi:hypothetical protein